MKNFSLFQKSFFLLLAISLFTFTACEDDPTGPGGGGTIPPSVRLTDDGVSSITTDATVASEAVIVLNVVASEGDSPMANLTVTEDGATVDIGRFVTGYIGGANPALLLGDNKTSINWNVAFTVHADSDTRTYAVVIVDDAGESSSVAVDITVESTPPTFSLNGPNAITVPVGLTTIKVSATAGGARLNTISVQEDGVDIDAARVSTFNGADYDANPYTLLEADKDGFTEAPLVMNTVTAEGETHSYTITLEDEAGNREIVSFDITTEVTGTAITDAFSGILFNRAGPTGTGGLNLITGQGSGSSDPDSHIRDEGVNTDLVPDVNWLQQISGINGSVIKAADTNTLPEGFSFTNVQFKEEIEGAFDTGLSLTETNDDGDLVTDRIEVGDLFLVRNGDNTFLIEIVEVNIVNTVAEPNGDNYVINIKY